MHKKGILIILDGYGEGEKGKFNAVENANTPFLNKLKAEQPTCLLGTSGNFVGLPEGAMGGSEVGHMTIGSGKIKRSMQVKVDEEIASKKFFENELLNKKLDNLKSKNGALHIGGLWSDKQIHADIRHTFALLKLAKMKGLEKVFLHAFTDGRDCPPQSTSKYFEMFNKAKQELGLGEIATIGGRFYVMDRENNLDRTDYAIDKFLQKEYDINSVEKAVEESYSRGENDEFIKPVRIKTEKEYGLDKNDLFVFYNTRGDRMRQPVKRLRERAVCDIVSFCEFAENVEYVYSEDNVENGLCEYLSNLGFKQLKISESTKYAHVTYFFNGGREEPFLGEERIHVITEKTEDYAKTPKMRAPEITNECIKAIKEDKFDAIYVNFSNPDMIGHTGNYEATITALECLDECVKRIVETAKEKDYFVIITADHGNAETMRDDDIVPNTRHSLNPVKFIVVDEDNKNIKLKDGGLKDVAPTFLKLMRVKPNLAFEGNCLFN